MGYDTFIYPLWGDGDLHWESSITHIPEGVDSVQYVPEGENFDQGG